MSLRCLLTGLILLATLPVSAEPIRLPVTQDNSIVLVDGEWAENAGQQGRIPVSECRR